MVEMTLSIIKPNAVNKKVVGRIITRFENEGLKIREMKMIKVPVKLARKFYAEHEKKPFFNELVDFMCSGRVVVMVLEGENAIALNREIMGATDPKNAGENTLRRLYADSIEANAVHGSDSPESAKREICLFFQKYAVRSVEKKAA